MYKPAIAKSVYISPSTQDKNIGQGSYGSEERVMNLIADVACTILLGSGLVVYRNSPSMDYASSTADSNNKLPGAHVAIHSNATGLKENKTTRGCEVFYSSGSLEGRRLAESVYKKIEGLTPVTDRGVKIGNFTEISKTLAPAALIEVDYHDNAAAASWILDNIQKLGEAIAEGICSFLGVECKISKPDITVKDHWAKQHRDDLIKKGIEIHEERYNDPITRGEVFALLNKIVK